MPDSAIALLGSRVRMRGINESLQASCNWSPVGFLGRHSVRGAAGELCSKVNVHNPAVGFPGVSEVNPVVHAPHKPIVSNPARRRPTANSPEPIAQAPTIRP
jgi:hypothetical protein